jgi:hypothetical protein
MLGRINPALRAIAARRTGLWFYQLAVEPSTRFDGLSRSANNVT